MIDSRTLDTQLKHKIAEHECGKGILKCFACGSCTARCPEMDVSPDFDARVIIRKALLGLKKEVFSAKFIWICSSHYRCLEKCPQQVNIKGVMNRIRNQRIKDENERTDASGKTADSMDMNFKYAIAEDEPGKDLFNCFTCGTCTAGCPERDLDPLYSPRKVIKNALLGMKQKVYDNKFVDICSSHYRCLQQCPQGVEIPKLMYAIRELAVAEGYTRP
jgi:heterodisulfide reductase subunit C